MRQRERDRRHFRDARNRMQTADGLQQQIAENRRSISANISAYTMGLAAVFYVMAALSGYVWSATGVALILLLIWFAVRVRRIANASTEQSEAAFDLRNFRLGINKKWGRIGAERKNEND